MDSRLGKSVRRLAMALLVAGMGLGGNASAVLLDRGDNMVYDTVLDITWTRQAGDGVLRTWADANQWAADLVFGGFDDWRLPYASVSAGAGPTGTVVECSAATEAECRDNEMGYMFYYNLGGSLFDDKTGDQTAVGDEELINIQLGYWSGTESSGPGVGWFFRFDFGDQGSDVRVVELWAWAVRDGDVAAVPAPGSLALLGLGLLALGFARRRRQQ